MEPMTPLSRSRCLHKALWLLAAMLPAAMLPSCAYVQTNKNVRELGRGYPGYKLDKPQEIYRSGNSWYVAATPAEYRLSHDLVHDNVFRKTNEPEMVLRHAETGRVAYHKLSDSTADVLLRDDGYAETATIAHELAESTEPWVDSLPGARVQQTRAQVTGNASEAVTGQPTPAEVPLGYQVLSGVDFVVIDIPTTVAYNVAVPFIAPFVFFYEFLSGE